MKKYLLILIASIGINFYLSAQSAGDYRSIGSGNWNDPTKWETYNGSSWISTTTYPGQNSGTGAVTIRIFHELKLTASVPNPIALLFIDQLNDYPAEGVVVSQNGIVTFSSANPVSLRVSGDVVIHGELKIDDLNGTKTHSLFVGANLEVNTVIYDDCGNIMEMIPATFQTINQDDKLGVVFTGDTWINSGPNGIAFQDVTLNCTRLVVTYPVHIKGAATFINGIVGISLYNDSYPCSIAINFNGCIVFHDGATVSGASNASFVDGIVAKLGDDPFTFPIGNGNVYGPLTISAPASQSDSVDAVYLRPNNWSSSPIIDPGLFNVSNCEVWGLNPGNNSLDVTVSWNAASGCGSSPYITNVSEVTLAHLSYQVGWDSHSGSGIGTTTNGSVTWRGVSNSGVFTLGNLGACNGPSGLNVTNITSTSATLNWTAVNGAVSYDVDYLQSGTGVWINAATATTSTSVNISGLNGGIRHYWQVRTNCSSSSSPYRGAVGFTTLCGAPTGLSTTNITNSSATLNWLAVVPNVSYRVDYKQSTSTTWIGTPNTRSLSFTLSGLAANSAYDWRISQICDYDMGNFVQSSFTTLQGPPPPPPPPPVCNDVYETNNTSSQAKAISFGNTISAGITSNNDFDWFKVTTPNNSNTNLDVRLSNLPADYDLYVYNKSLKLIGSSVALGTSNEMVTYNSSARKATYYIKVVGKGGVYNVSQCYNLLALSLSLNAGSRTISHAAAPVNDVTGDPNNQLLYPNPASEFVQLSFNSTVDGSAAVQIFNTTGQLIKQPVIKINKGYNQVKVAVSDIKQGMYLLKINKGELNMVRRFVIAR